MISNKTINLSNFVNKMKENEDLSKLSANSKLIQYFK